VQGNARGVPHSSEHEQCSKMLRQLQNEKLVCNIQEVKRTVWRYAFVYYNRQRVTTVNEGGWPSSIYRKRTIAGKAVDKINFGYFGTELLLTISL